MGLVATKNSLLRSVEDQQPGATHASCFSFPLGLLSLNPNVKGKVNLQWTSLPDTCSVACAKLVGAPRWEFALFSLSSTRYTLKPHLWQEWQIGFVFYANMADRTWLLEDWGPVSPRLCQAQQESPAQSVVLSAKGTGGDTGGPWLACCHPQPME